MGRCGPSRMSSDRRHRLRHQAGIGQRRQIDDPDAVGKAIEHVRGQLERQARLAAAAGAGERQQPGGRDEPQELRDFPIAPDEVRELAPEGCDGSVATSLADGTRGRRSRSDARSG